VLAEGAEGVGEVFKVVDGIVDEIIDIVVDFLVGLHNYQIQSNNTPL
jgi:hypothetical protein